MRADLLCLIEGMAHAPAFVHGRHGNILAWNESAGRLLGDLDTLPPARRSWPHLVLLDGPFRSMIGDTEWEPLARQHVAYLRLCLGRYPHDPEVVAVIESLHSVERRTSAGSGPSTRSRTGPASPAACGTRRRVTSRSPSTS